MSFWKKLFGENKAEESELPFCAGRGGNHKMSEKRICTHCGNNYVSKGKDVCAMCFAGEGAIDAINRGSEALGPPYAVKVQYTEPSKESIDEILRIMDGERWEDIVKSKKKWWHFWK